MSENPLQLAHTPEEHLAEAERLLDETKQHMAEQEKIPWQVAVELAKLHARIAELSASAEFRARRRAVLRRMMTEESE